MWVNEDGQTPIEWVQDKAPEEARALVLSFNKGGRYARVKARKVEAGRDLYDTMEAIASDIQTTLTEEGNSQRFRLEWNDSGKVGQSDLESLGCSTFNHLGPSVVTAGADHVGGTVSMRELEFVRTIAELRNALVEERAESRKDRAELFSYIEQSIGLNFKLQDRVMSLTEKVADAKGDFDARKAEADLERLKIEQEHELKNAAVEGVAMALSPVAKALGVKLGVSVDSEDNDEGEYRVDE